MVFRLDAPRSALITTGQDQRAKNTHEAYELALATLTLIHSNRMQETKEAAHRLISLQQKGSYWTTKQTVTYSG